MEYLGFWVSRDGVKPMNKKIEVIKKYEATYFPKRSMTVYRCSELLPRYVVKTLTYVSAYAKITSVKVKFK